MDMNKTMDLLTDGLVKELLKEENWDLMNKVRDLGDSNSGDSFIWGFEKNHLEENQIIRWKNIIKPFGKGLSGFSYGFMCRKAQAILREDTVVS